MRQAEIFFAERNHELRLAARAVEMAEADILSAAARPNPTLSVGTSQISPSAGIGAGKLHDKRVDTVVGLSTVFERGNKRALRTDAAELAAQAARSERADIERQQRVNLIAAYYDLLLAQEKAAVSAQTAGLFGKTLRAAELRVQAGDIAAADVARISVDALRAENEARAAVAERERAQIELARLIGAEAHAARVRAVDPWPEPTPREPLADLDRLLESRSDVQAAAARIGAAEKARELALALRTRDVTAGIQYERFPGDTANNSYGVFFSVPLFTSYYYGGEIRRAEAELDAARDNLERVRALARAEIRRARADLDAAVERSRRFSETLSSAAEKAASAAEFAYSRGALGVMDLLDARRLLHATQLEAVGARAEYARAAAAWQAAIAPGPGTSGPPQLPRSK